MRLSLIPLRDQADLQGPSHLGLLLLTVIYRDRVKWVCLAVGLFTGSVSFEFHFGKSPRNVWLYIDSIMISKL